MCFHSLQPGCSGNTRRGPSSTPSPFMPSQRTELSLTQSVSLQCQAVGCVCCLARWFRGIPCHCRHDYCSGANWRLSSRRFRSFQEDCVVSEWGTSAINQQRNNNGPLPPWGWAQIMVEVMVLKVSKFVHNCLFGNKIYTYIFQSLKVKNTPGVDMHTPEFEYVALWTKKPLTSSTWELLGGARKRRLVYFWCTA